MKMPMNIAAINAAVKKARASAEREWNRSQGLNRSGNRRGMGGGRRFTSLEEARKAYNKGRASAQQRSQVLRSRSRSQREIYREKIRQHRAETGKEPTAREKMAMAEDAILSASGKGVKKSLLAMAQKRHESAETVRWIASADEARLEKAYNENMFTFEGYWEYKGEMDPGPDEGSIEAIKAAYARAG
jgi:hypothetical protein